MIEASPTTFERRLTPRPVFLADKAWFYDKTISLRFARRLSASTGVEVTAEFDDRREVWRLSWTDPALDKAQVQSAAKANKTLDGLRTGIVLAPPDRGC